MGAICCCFHVPDVPDNTSADNSSSDDCFCPKCFFHKLINKVNLLTRSQMLATSSSPNQQASSSNSEGTSGSRVQPEPVRQSVILGNPKSKQGDNTFVSNCEVGSLKQNSESSDKIWSGRLESESTCIFPSPDEEDVCPTCLEEYDEENPKIIAKCSHHYHLSCIYEWMERSKTCPICGKLMLFDESS